MKEDIKKLFTEIISDTPHPLPLRYYGKLQTLTGLVYDKEQDIEIAKDLAELSNYVQLLSNLDTFEDQFRQLVPRQTDFHHMFDTGLDYRNINLTSPTINFPQTITFPENNYEVPKELVELLSRQIDKVKAFDFNVPKLIAWIKTKIETINESNNN